MASAVLVFGPEQFYFFPDPCLVSLLDEADHLAPTTSMSDSPSSHTYQRSIDRIFRFEASCSLELTRLEGTAARIADRYRAQGAHGIVTNSKSGINVSITYLMITKFSMNHENLR